MNPTFREILRWLWCPHTVTTQIDNEHEIVWWCDHCGFGRVRRLKPVRTPSEA